MMEHFTMLWFVHGVEYDEELAIESLMTLWAQAIGLQLPDASAGVGASVD